MNCTLARQAKEEDVDSHGEKFRLIVLDRQKGVVLLLVEVLKREEDEDRCSLTILGLTAIAARVKSPPVAEVSS